MDRRRLLTALRIRIQRPIVSLRGRVLRATRPQRQAAVREDLDDLPILIAGCHRSGTSLLRRCIDSHSRIHCPAETLFLEYLGGAVGNPTAPKGWEAIGLARDHMAEQWGSWAEEQFRRTAAEHGKPRWADKSPGILMELDGVDALFGERARYVAIVRDGMDVATSLGRSSPPWWQLRPLLRIEPDPYVAAAHYWAERNERLADFADRHPERVHVLLYRDLVRSPEPTLRAAFDFLGEAWEDSVLDFNRHSHAGGLEDHHVSTTTTFQDNTGRHRNLPIETQRRMWAAIEPVMARFGYESRTY